LGEEAPAWTTWPGRWGDTRPRFAGIDTPSPDGPAAHDQWEDPAVLLRHDTEDREHGPAPPAPAVRVRRDQGHLRIDYDHSALGPTAPVPDRLVVTVNSRDERLAPDRRPPETYTFVVDQALRGHVIARRRLQDAKHYDVSVSAVLLTGHPSSGVPTAAERFELPAVGDRPRRLGALLGAVSGLFARLRRGRRR
jgi:hypothetical protein